MTRRALVLGAGGHAAIAWEIGVIAGAADAGIDLCRADLFIGTSAGSVVGAQLGHETPDAAFERQVDPGLQTRESPPPIDFATWRAEYVRAKGGGGTPIDVLKRIGRMAHAARTVAAPERRAMMAARLPADAWPARDLLIVAVNADTGERRVFDRKAGVSLVDAVTASGAVPGIWPLVTIDERPYMDGGVYSIDNADLAAGCDRALVLTLRPRVPPLCLVSLDAALETLRAEGTRVEVVYPDEQSERAFGAVAGNLLDPAVRSAAARAGREQGRRMAARIADVWT